jgi:hypothetical protein
VSDAPVDGGPAVDGRVDVLPGDVVRELVERHERELESLAEDLAEARRHADEAEARVREHPALGLLGSDEAARLLPPARPPEPPASTAPSGERAPGTRPPATTVVRRPPHAQQVGSVRPDDDGGTAAPVAPETRSRGARLATSHWVWKAGVGLTVVALLLLKFG